MSIGPGDNRTRELVSRTGAVRRGTWLLLGWLAFWIGNTVYPCQAHHAAISMSGTPVALSMFSSVDAGTGKPGSRPAHDNGTCQELTAPSISAPAAFAAITGVLDTHTLLPAALDVGRPARASLAVGTHAAPQAPPHTPQYLSTRRLLN